MTRRDHTPDITEQDLLNYADGRLEPGSARYIAVETYLATRPAEHERITDYARQNRALHAAYADVFADSLPERLSPARIRADVRARRRRHLATGAAACAVLALGVALTQAIHRAAPLDRFAERAATELAASDRQDASGSPAATAATAPATVRWPNLRNLGFQRVTSARVRASERPMYRAVYSDPQGRRVRLFVSPETRDRRPELHRIERNGRKLVYWKQGGHMYALAGELSERKLESVVAATMNTGDSPMVVAGEPDGPAPPGPAGELSGDRGVDSLPMPRTDYLERSKLNGERPRGREAVSERLDSPLMLPASDEAG